MDHDEDNESREDLTEEASPYRLEEFRRKGFVSQSKELTSLIVLIGVATTGYIMSSSFSKALINFIHDIFFFGFSFHFDLSADGNLRKIFLKALNIFFYFSLPVCLVGFFLGILFSFFQIGSIFSLEPLSPDFKRLNPSQFLKKFISVKQLIDVLRIFLKIFSVSFVAFFLVKLEISSIPNYLGEDLIHVLLKYKTSSQKIFFYLIIVLFFYALLDFVFQKFEYNKSLRVTKKEAKKEHKEKEGDPQIKARIRSIQREIARKRMMQAVKKADVIITNPSHVAVALNYDKKLMTAPKVVAKGVDFLAQKIKQTAQTSGVPLVENVILARALYKTTKVGHVIPKELYQAVAEVLAYVYRLKKKYV